MKSFVGYIIDKAVKAIPKKKKVSPDIKSVKPTKLPVSESIKKTKGDEYRKRYTALDKAEGKLKTGKQMMKEGQKERKKLIDTKRAFQFKHTKSTHAIKPGEDPNVKYKGNVREQKMGGGMMGRRFGMKKGSKFPDLTGDGKVTFADILKGRGVINGKKKKKKA